MNRINVPLDKIELAALISMAQSDCRHPREQLRFLLRTEAERRGLLAAEPTPTVARVVEPIGAQHDSTRR